MRTLLAIAFIFTILGSCAQKTAPPTGSPSLPLAFPGAEGFGKYTTGGRGGKVYTVTNLNDNGPGSFREAIKKKGARTIVFAISGTIALESDLSINNGDLTIAGQTAPGDGICIKNFPVRISASNVIIRHIRFRLGDERKVQDDAVSGTRQKNIIIDHCSMSWATDECASFYYNENFTLQWCIISESLNQSVHEKGAHGYGGIWGGVKASFHHNLIASHTSRLPRFSGSSTTRNTPDELVDFCNNVIYNWGQNNTYGGELGHYNVVNNYYKPGPATPANRKGYFINPSSPIGKFHIDGNVLEGNDQVNRNNWNGVKVSSLDSAMATKAFPSELMITESAEVAFEKVLKNAGAGFKRDTVDLRIIREVRTGTSTAGNKKDGIIDSQNMVGGWPELKTSKVWVDSDGDGIPDEWELNEKLNPKDPSDGPVHLEKYLNWLEVLRAPIYKH